MKVAPMVKGVGLHWFRKGIRLHDNPALLEACNSDRFFGVYCLDPTFANPDVVGYNRYKFLLESLNNLDENLRSMGSRLFVLQGKPQDALIEFACQYGVTTVTFERDTEPYAKVRDKQMVEMFRSKGIAVSTHATHMLRDPEEYIQACRRQNKPVPNSYVAFCKLFESLGPLRKEAEAPVVIPTYLTDHTSAPDSLAADLSGPAFNVPSLEEMGYTDASSTLHSTMVGTQYPGGESEALRRLERTVTAKEREQWVRTFEKPNTAPNSIQPSTTVLSPYMKFGCLSAVVFFHALDRVVAKGRRTEPPVSLHGQLLWREFFYLNSYTTPNFDKMEGNPHCRQIPWGRDASLIAAWKEGRTGFPFIDAIMTQLRVEGWIHHLARHAVACFLTRGDLYQHWEEGARVFDLWLLDSDWALNNANWQWLSCSNFYYQYFRVYSPIAFGKKTDPEGAYIRHWLPQLAAYPAKYIYSPWEASAEQQRAWGCVLGQHYPHPLVEHSAASKECMRRMQLAYAQDKTNREGGSAGEEHSGGASSKGSAGSKKRKSTTDTDSGATGGTTSTGKGKQAKISTFFSDK